MKPLVPICVLLLISVRLQAQPAREEHVLRGVWYNVENLFDAEDISEELRERGWSARKYEKKLQAVAKVIAAAGEWGGVGLVGLCEVEGAAVLESLVARTCLKTEPYGYALTAGADRRGIQVALLYRLADFEKLEEHSYRIDLAGARPTRDILHVCGKLCSGDTLDILLCHFPSQSGGEMETEWMRRRAGRRLRGLCDSLAAVRRNGGNILVMGDFNEGSDSEVLRNDVGAEPWKKPLVSRDPLDSPAAIVPRRLYLMPCVGGTHKYHGEWSPLDRIIVAESLLDTIGTLRLDPESVRRMDAPFLMVEDKTYGGRRPRHTFYGHRYEAGPSDHLPLLFSLLLRCPPPSSGHP